MQSKAFTFNSHDIAYILAAICSYLLLNEDSVSQLLLSFHINQTLIEQLFNLLIFGHKLYVSGIIPSVEDADAKTQANSPETTVTNPQI